MQNRFSDNLSGDLSGSDLGISGFYNKKRTVGQRNQAGVLMTMIGVGLLGAIGWRLSYLQLSQGTVNRQIAETNRVRTKLELPNVASALN